MIKLRTPQRILLAAAAALPAMTFAFPVWQIGIWAPQYPEGLNMFIGLDRIEGNVEQINILNHYIGMKHIIPSEIPELLLLPKLIFGLIVLGFLAAVINRVWALRAWLGLFSAFAVAGFLDFYRWGYEYGHNLNPDAPIKIPGMSYQPPLIGAKTILNIDALSLPHVGGIAVGLAFVLGFAALFWNQIRDFQVAKDAKTKFLHPATMRTGLTLLAFIGLSGCSAEPEAIVLGSDACAGCHMTISDARFGGEVITDKGKIHKFDSLPCLLEYVRANEPKSKSILVTDYMRPGSLIDARSANYLRSRAINGPMGDQTAASKSHVALQSVQARAPGELLRWDAILRHSP